MAPGHKWLMYGSAKKWEGAETQRGWDLWFVPTPACPESQGVLPEVWEREVGRSVCRMQATAHPAAI